MAALDLRPYGGTGEPAVRVDAERRKTIGEEAHRRGLPRTRIRRWRLGKCRSSCTRQLVAPRMPVPVPGPRNSTYTEGHCSKHGCAYRSRPLQSQWTQQSQEKCLGPIGPWSNIALPARNSAD